MTHVMVARWRPREDAAEKIEAILGELAKAISKEPGNVQFTVHNSASRLSGHARNFAISVHDWHELALVERIGCFGPHPMRSDRMLRPHHDDDTGLRNRFLDLRVVGVALLDAAAIDPHRHAFLL